jgi:hypothetical protein
MNRWWSHSPTEDLDLGGLVRQRDALRSTPVRIASHARLHWWSSHSVTAMLGGAQPPYLHGLRPPQTASHDDLVSWIQRSHPSSRFILVGFSAGGSFALRITNEAVGKRFIKIVAIAPYLGFKDPATRPNNAGGWVKPYTVRLLGLKMLNSMGIYAFDGLPIAAFALPKNGDPARGTPTWSYRLVENFNTHGGPSLFTPRDTWWDDIRGADTRLAVLFGADDPGIDPAKARAEFAATAVERSRASQRRLAIGRC